MNIRDNGDGTVDLFNAAGSWIGRMRKGADGITLGATPLDDTERRALEVQARIAIGPTRNGSYNDLLVRWAASGHDSSPECEECGTDLTGKRVHETSCGWLCTACRFDEDTAEAVTSWREDFHADG